MRQFMAVAKALADENRVRVLLALRGRELCVCQVIEFLGLAPSTVSKHMSILRQAGLVEGGKDGRWVYYRLAGGDAPKAALNAIQWTCDCLAKSTRVREDAVRLRKICKRSVKACEG